MEITTNSNNIQPHGTFWKWIILYNWDFLIEHTWFYTLWSFLNRRSEFTFHWWFKAIILKNNHPACYERNIFNDYWAWPDPKTTLDDHDLCISESLYTVISLCPFVCQMALLCCLLKVSSMWFWNSAKHILNLCSMPYSNRTSNNILIFLGLSFPI